MGATLSWPVAMQPEQGLRCEQESSAQEVELGASKHRPLPHLQAIHLAFDGAITPGQRDPSFHRLIVRPQPSGTAPEWGHTAGGGSFQPGIEAVGLACTDEVSKVLRQGDRHR